MQLERLEAAAAAFHAAPDPKIDFDYMVILTLSEYEDLLAEVDASETLTLNEKNNIRYFCSHHGLGFAVDGSEDQ